MARSQRREPVHVIASSTTRIGHVLVSCRHLIGVAANVANTVFNTMLGHSTEGSGGEPRQCRDAPGAGTPRKMLRNVATIR